MRARDRGKIPPSLVVPGRISEIISFIQAIKGKDNH